MKFPISNFQFPISRRAGQSLVELLIAMTVGTIMVIAAMTIIVPALKSNTEVTRTQTAVALGKELLENVRVFGEANWNNVLGLSTSSANTYYLRATSSPFSAATGTETITVGTTTYNRYFFIDDVNRDGSGFIAGSGVYDPSTKKVTVAYGKSDAATSTVLMYITRFKHRIYNQTDWSAGSGQTGPSTTTDSRFDNSTSVNYSTTSGSIIITL